MRHAFTRQRLWRLTPDAFQAATRLLARAARDHLGEVRLVVGVGTGGSLPAYAIGTQVDARVVIVTAKHDTSGEIACDLGSLQALSRVEPLTGPFLVVGDICGSGATLAAVTAALRSLAEPRSMIRTAALCRHTDAEDGVPDLYVWDVADWVVFPWEYPPAKQPTSPLPLPMQVRTTCHPSTAESSPERRHAVMLPIRAGAGRPTSEREPRADEPRPERAR
ncbi:phosphoribosyltransferase family protein [Thermoactinospora rubra]|uniref:phosphoribosyltransferase family protein n=1 Tax=Thermoactinospora rubra TaxID=1088767 RepID=UPI000A0F7C38|nr:phosphoribosyltransferase family protein [Thermoactinospora rubra]